MTRTVHTPWQLALFAARADVPVACRVRALRAHVAGMPHRFRHTVNVMLNMITDDQTALKSRRN